MKKMPHSLLVLSCLLTLSSVGAAASTIRGDVRSSKAPLSGAIITVRADGSNVETSVYSDSRGAFSVNVQGTGRYSVRARFPGHTDETLPIDLTLGNRSDVHLNLAAATDPLLNAPSSAWLAQLPDSMMKRKFIVNCGTCHEISHTRVYKDGKVRDQEHWELAISMMKAMDVYSLIPPELDTKQYAKWLAESLSPARVAAIKPASGA
jgi:hypothetical protein